MGPLFSLKIHRKPNIHDPTSLYRQHPFSFQNGSSALLNPPSTSTSTSYERSPWTNTTKSHFRLHLPLAPLLGPDRTETTSNASHII